MNQHCDSCKELNWAGEIEEQEQQRKRAEFAEFTIVQLNRRLDRIHEAVHKLGDGNELTYEIACILSEVVDCEACWSMHDDLS